MRPVSTAAAGDMSEVTNLAVLAGELDATFSAQRTEPRALLFDHAQPTGRSALVGARLWRSSLAVAHVTRVPGPAPAPLPFANGEGKVCTTDNDSTRKSTDKTANFLDLPINSMTKNEGNLYDSNYPHSRLRTIRRRRC